MRRLPWILLICLTATALAAPKLSRDEARTRISEFVSFKLEPDAIEIRRITQQAPDSAVADTTVTLAFQFKKDQNGDWALDAIRLGDHDWVDMVELIAAVYHGNPPVQPKIARPKTPPRTPVERFHVNPTEFEQARKRMTELGLSPLVPPEIDIRRISFQNDTRTIAEATITLGFQFKLAPRTGKWAIEAARLGEKSWINTNDLLVTLNDGRRRSTLEAMKKLASGIDRYVLEDGSLPPGRDVVEITNALYPNYMKDLVRRDGWGQPLEYEPSGTTFRLRSMGPDGRRGTSDDIVFP